MIRHRFLGTDTEPFGKPCHECGREWWQVDDGYQPDPRLFVEIRGAVGHCQVLTVICPQCADALAAVAWAASDWERTNPIASHRDYLDGVRLSKLLSEREMFVEQVKFRPVIRFTERARS